MLFVCLFCFCFCFVFQKPLVTTTSRAMFCKLATKILFIVAICNVLTLRRVVAMLSPICVSFVHHLAASMIVFLNVLPECTLWPRTFPVCHFPGWTKTRQKYIIDWMFSSDSIYFWLLNPAAMIWGACARKVMGSYHISLQKTCKCWNTKELHVYGSISGW